MKHNIEHIRPLCKTKVQLIDSTCNRFTEADQSRDDLLPPLHRHHTTIALSSSLFIGRCAHDGTPFDYRME